MLPNLAFGVIMVPSMITKKPGGIGNTNGERVRD